MFESKKSLLFLLLLAGTIFVFYNFISRHNDFKNYKEILLKEKAPTSEKQAQPVTPTRIASTKTGKTWLDIQKQVKDTVVQVYSQISVTNLFEPYKTPEQGEGAGSGFFINDKGNFITNYHVVAQAINTQIQIPSFGMERFDAEIIGVSPERDIALLRLTKESYDKIKKKLGKIPYLPLGNSDAVLRSQEVLALGFPLGQIRLKSTLGIVSGRERLSFFGYIQITAPLNPGNSGGPALNAEGDVIGINAKGVLEAQNVGYIIPINEVKNALNDLYKIKLLRRPTLGCIFHHGNQELLKYLGNPGDGGWYIAKVFENALMESIGIQEDDMIYEANGFAVDMYGDVNVPWSEDKISFFELLNRFKTGDNMQFVIYRRGSKKVFNFKLEHKYLPPIRQVYPEFEPETMDYEVIGGLVVMQMSLNHINAMISHAPDLVRYFRSENQHEPAVLVTHVLPNSQAYKTRVLVPGEVVTDVNDIPIKTLADFRKAVQKSKTSHYLTIRTDDNYYGVMSIDKIIKEEDLLAGRFFFKKSKLIDALSK
jgi:serine protease Do